MQRSRDSRVCPPAYQPTATPRLRATRLVERLQRAQNKVRSTAPAGRHGVDQDVLVQCRSFVRIHHQLAVLQVLGVVAGTELNRDDVEEAHLGPVKIGPIADFRMVDGRNLTVLEKQAALPLVQQLERRAQNWHSAEGLQVLVPRLK